MQKFMAQNAVLIGALIAIAASNLAIGIMVPIIPPVLQQEGLTARVIGLNTSIGQLGVLLAGFSLPLLAQRFASKKLVLFACGLMALSFLGFATTRPVWNWFAIRFCTGIGIAIMFTISETWITVEAGDARRARVMGIYHSILTLTFGLGPFLVSWTGIESVFPWLAGACLLALAFAVVGSLKIPEMKREGKAASLLATMGKAPVLYLCIAMTTLFEAIMLSFFTLYLAHRGVALETANQVLGFSIIGCLCFFYPIAHAADRWSRNKTALLCTVLAIVCAIVLPVFATTILVWPLTLLLRVGAFGLYVVALALVGDTFKGNELVAASAAVAICWGLGGILGPPLTGFLIDEFGMVVFPWAMAACDGVALFAMLLLGGRILHSPGLPNAARTGIETK